LRSYMQTWDESVTVLLLIVYEWGRLQVPNTHNSAPTTTPTNSTWVNPADFWINHQYFNQWALVFELQRMEFACYCRTSTTFSHQTPVVVVCILQTGKSNKERKEIWFASSDQWGRPSRHRDSLVMATTGSCHALFQCLQCWQHFKCWRFW
jgi:hypothetical protein